MNLGLRLLPGLLKPSLILPGRPLLCMLLHMKSSFHSSLRSKTKKNSPPSTRPTIVKNICTTNWLIDGKNPSKEKLIENKEK